MRGKGASVPSWGSELWVSCGCGQADNLSRGEIGFSAKPKVNGWEYGWE